MFGFTFDLAVDVNISVDQVDLLARQPDEPLDVVLPLIEGEDDDIPCLLYTSDAADDLL